MQFADMLFFSSSLFFKKTKEKKERYSNVIVYVPVTAIRNLVKSHQRGVMCLTSYEHSTSFKVSIYMVIFLLSFPHLTDYQVHANTSSPPSFPSRSPVAGRKKTNSDILAIMPPNALVKPFAS